MWIKKFVQALHPDKILMFFICFSPLLMLYLKRNYPIEISLFLSYLEYTLERVFLYNNTKLLFHPLSNRDFKIRKSTLEEH